MGKVGGVEVQTDAPLLGVVHPLGKFGGGDAHTGKCIVCMDAGHFHPTETIGPKLLRSM